MTIWLYLHCPLLHNWHSSKVWKIKSTSIRSEESNRPGRLEGREMNVHIHALPLADKYEIAETKLQYKGECSFISSKTEVNRTRINRVITCECISQSMRPSPLSRITVTSCNYSPQWLHQLLAVVVLICSRFEANNKTYYLEFLFLA